MVYNRRIVDVIGTSTKVSAIASAKGWYMAALWWCWVIGLTEKRAGRNTALQSLLDEEWEIGEDWQK